MNPCKCGHDKSLHGTSGCVYHLTNTYFCNCNEFREVDKDDVTGWHNIDDEKIQKQKEENK